MFSRPGLAALAALATMAACTPATTHATSPAARRWTAVTLPADPRGRPEIRAAAACGDRVYVSGAILGRDGGTAPALWSGVAGGPLAARATAPRTPYGPSHVLYSVACRGVDAVAVGASNGGAHGNARTNTWLATGDGPVAEVPSPFETFGGPEALGVGRISGGPAGYLIVGGRQTAAHGGGAAVWVSGDGRAFTLVDDDPALVGDGRGVTEAHAAAVTGDGFVAVGGITPPGSPLAARDPIAWRSTDGRTWTRDAFPATPGDDVLLGVVPAAGGAVAVGAEGDAFRVWRLTGGQWRPGARFGHIGAGGEVPAVGSLAADPAGNVYAVVADGAAYHLWDLTRMTEIALPEAVAAAPVATGPRVVCAVVAGRTLVLATDDGTAAKVWTTPA